MKFKLIISSLFVSSLFATTANATIGTVNFKGEITDKTCEIDAASANQTVNMGKVSVKEFSGENKVAAATKFSIKLTECPTEIKNALVKFDGSSHESKGKLLALTTDSKNAKGVAIGIYEDNSDNLVGLYKDSKSYAIEKGAAELPFIAKYVATSDNVSAGSANAVARFTVVYN
ncbi:putative fimbrial-like adhesin protein [Xenorhabdus bovienii str. Jollieti]|uniref:Putative fimbrial-like adhesin protein n=1 Tax=Xenorhabdus bovienii (strain SS-2004) TaxID=406818 RepID=D3UWQ0_XENBS|nr:fimbrial protein [Xenorhabdus bovienii]CBJ79885.1 putative fimbrial-like adhesin protein [Xenorhabdus bovienii SS-2004]CDH29602.1 putative fimbrial-like adhesin protein [Xenorhabdus bovienii str. Jollieti]